MSEDDIKEISTGIVLLKEDDKGNRKILLIERFERGTFEIPKGHVEDYDKTVKMAAERELREVSLFVFSRNPRNKIR
jgi:8-oxo-dGTP pyrophosphatase MutT (NUDIX family)